MIIKTYRFWFLSSLILHVVLLLGVNAMNVPTQAPPEELLVPVKMVPLEDPPPPPKPIPVVEPVNEPIKAIPPDPKSTHKPTKDVEPVKPSPRRTVEKPREQPRPERPAAPQPPRTPSPAAAPPKHVQTQPVVTPSAAPAIMRSEHGGKMAAPPGVVDSMGEQGTVKGPPTPPTPPPPPPGPTYGAESLGGPTPGYPKLAQEDGLEGSVTLSVHVKESGDFSATVSRSSGHSSLDKAALTAIKSWRFKPAMKNGELTTGTVSVRFTFSGEKVQGVVL